LQWNFNGSSQYFSANLGAAQLEGFTIIAIGTPTNVSTGGAIATIADTVLAQGSYGLRINAGVVGAYAYSTAGAFNESTHAVAAVNNKTYVFGAVFASTASRTVYLNGTPGTPNTTSGAVTSASQFSIGVLNRSGITQYWPGGVNGVFVLPWALTDAEMARMKTPADVYAAMYAPIQRTIWVPAAAGGGVSGTLATTNANDTSAATGTTTVTGTLAKTNANDSSSASGTTTVTGTLARTNANDTSAASGTTTVTGTLAKTNANDSVSASGDVGGNITGTVNYTNANDTSAASGTTTVTGSLAKTNANDSASASGTTTVTGSLARTNANDSVVASGAAGTVTGTVNVTNDNDTSSASGTAGNPVIASQGGGGWLPQTRRKSRKQIYEERVKLGILPPPVIKAAAKVAAVAQTVEEFKEERPKYEEMFLKAIKKTEWLPDYTRAIQAQLAIMELEEEELLLLL
jgi:hypothetical protein